MGIIAGRRKHLMKNVNGCRLLSAFLLAAVTVSGCNTLMATGVTKNASDTAPSITEDIVISETTAATTEETAKEPEPLTFNTHVYSCFLDACYSDDYRESFFNLCDALQKGEDTFKCTNEDIYKFCLDPVTLNQLYPVGCMQIMEKAPEGEPSFENGTGHIYYTNSKEDFLEKQAQFQTNIMAILDAYITSDMTDFEKCLSLYEYMVCTYEYDYDDELNRSELGSGCATLKYRKGVCGDFSALYSYLLLQSGVDAIAVSNWGETDETGYHAWTFVEVDGKGYHIDPTWGLKADKSVETFTLDFFMMTDEDRAEWGYPPELLDIYLLPTFYAKDCKEYDFTANDRSYRLPDGSQCCGYDTDRNIIFYYDYSYNYDKHTFQYE